MLIPVLGHVIYDGNCGFCRRVVGWVRRRAGIRLNYIPSDNAPPEYKAVGQQSVLLLDAQGRFYQGAGAVFKMREILGSPFVWNFYQTHRWFAALSETGYRLVSLARPVLSTALDVLLGPPPEDL